MIQLEPVDLANTATRMPKLFLSYLPFLTLLSEAYSAYIHSSHGKGFDEVVRALCRRKLVQILHRGHVDRVQGVQIMQLLGNFSRGNNVW